MNNPQLGNHGNEFTKKRSKPGCTMASRKRSEVSFGHDNLNLRMTKKGIGFTQCLNLMNQKWGASLMNAMFLIARKVFSQTLGIRGL